MLRVIHANGQTVYPGDGFTVHDSSGTLIVCADRACKQPIAAFNREFWVHIGFVTQEQLDAEHQSELEEVADGERQDLVDDRGLS